VVLELVVLVPRMEHPAQTQFFQLSHPPVAVLVLVKMLCQTRVEPEVLVEEATLLLVAQGLQVQFKAMMEERGSTGKLMVAVAVEVPVLLEEHQQARFQVLAETVQQLPYLVLL